MKKIIKLITVVSLMMFACVLALTSCEALTSATGEAQTDNTPTHTHVEVVDKGVSPTCTTTGLTAGKHCSVCNKVLEEQKVIEAYGHIETTVPGYAATCMSAGLSDGKKCSICNEMTVEQQTINAKGHTVVVDDEVPATCTEDGLTEGKHCSECDKVIIAQKVVPAGHTVVVDRAKAPTCTETGLTEGSHCSVCSTVFTAQELIPASHSFGEWDVITEATESADGLKRRDCANCNEYETEVIPALDHDHYSWPVTTLEAVAVTCTEDGLTEGKKCGKCGQILVAQQVIPATGHNEQVIPAADPTCTEDGCTEGRGCTKCGAVFVASEVIPAKGHTEVTVAGREATCTSPGRTDGKRCTTCNNTTVPQTTIAALGHDKINYSAKAPTCTEVGWYDYYVCTRCNDNNYFERPIKAHTEVDDPAVAPGCVTTGLTAGKHCSACGLVTQAQQTISALGHSMKDPTCTVPETCSVCSATGKAALGHTYAVPTSPNYNGVCVSACVRCKLRESNVTVITYEAYGAVGDGVTDDSEAIRRAHNAANKLGLPVEGTKGDTYYIGAITSTITIKTNTNWNGATFIFDDSTIRWDNSALSGVDVFTVAPDTAGRTVTVPAALVNNGLKAGQTNIGMTFATDVMLKIENSNERIFKRYGVNEDEGDVKQEMLYVDKNGNVIGTPIQYDYSTITKITVYSVTDTAITIQNGKIITIVPDPKAQDPDYENNYCYYNRGILIKRSNTILYNIEHIIEGEDMSVIIDRDGDKKTGDADPDGDGIPEKWGDDKSYGVPYRGFFSFEYAYNVALDHCKVQGHQAYNFYQSGGRNEMGSYDIYAKHCIGLQLLYVTQRERYGDYPDETVITNRFMYHGVMGSYYCRNIVMDNCYLDRFDSHKGMHNARITNSVLGFGILVIGGGELYIENVYRVSENHFILLREDYNSVFDGDIIIKNCRMGPNIKNIIAGSWRSYETGFPSNYMVRSLTIDGLVVETSGRGSNYQIYLFAISGASTSALTDSKCPLVKPEFVSYTGITKENVSGLGYSNLVVNISKNSGDVFSSVTKK